MITCLKTSSRGNEALAKKSEMDLILVTSAATSLKSVFENAAPECARPGRSQMNPSSALAKSAPGDGRTPAWTAPSQNEFSNTLLGQLPRRAIRTAQHLTRPRIVPDDLFFRVPL